MKRTDFQPIKEILKDILKEERFRSKLGEAQIIEYWEIAVGATIGKETERIFIKNRKLFVKIGSPMAKNDLLYRRKELIKTLNNYVNDSIIDDIIFI
ncbi:MAG: DUF721 domain-containing protein [Paludibacteraceae bacterium]|nr:DUF721 domain-containing protein [Paludibacteraceae bacterium]